MCFFFKQKTAYEIKECDWSSDVCSSDLQPLMTAGYAVEKLGAAPTTIGSLLDKATKLGIVEEITGQKRNRVYRYSPFLDLFTSEDTPGPGAAVEVTL